MAEITYLKCLVIEKINLQKLKKEYGFKKKSYILKNF
jgi:hypothetical protein